MKYWTELNNLEDAIFQIKKLNSQLSVMMDSELITSNDERIPEAYKDFLYDFSDRFESAMAELNSDFQTVWDVIRNDSFDAKESTDKTRWSRIVGDLQRWNEDLMSSPATHEDKIVIHSEEINLNCSDIKLDTNFSEELPKILVLKEEDGNITTSYRPFTQEDLFDEQWKESYKKQSER